MMDLVEQAINDFFEGEYEKAEKKLRRLIKSRKNDPWVWFLKGLIDRKKGDNSEALDALETAIKLRKDFVEAWVLRGIILRDLKRFKDALIAFDTAIEIQISNDDYNDYELMLEKAKTYIEMGDKNKARRIIDMVKEINPEDDELKDLEAKLSQSKIRRG